MFIVVILFYLLLIKYVWEYEMAYSFKDLKKTHFYVAKVYT